MRVAFDSRPGKDLRGIGRYTRCLLEAMRALELGEIIETHRPRRCELFHAPWIDGALLRSPVPMVVTLHDLIPLKRPGEYLRSGLRFKLRYLAVQRAVRVVVPSRAVADDAISMLGIPAGRIEVIPEAADATLSPRSEPEVAGARARYGLPERYLLWVGGLRTPEPRKRVAALARVPRTLPLVLVGEPGKWATELEGVTLTGEVSDEDLAAIYTGAHALVFPSDDEGFGLPVVEALACGTPVAACELPAIREVVGPRVALAPVEDLEELIRIAEAARRPAPAPPAWSWENAARATWDVYEQAVSAPTTWRGARRGARGAGAA
jgi:alpha-1,3-rhamnosyl/mannosyltransferase